jgi:hypothetical protein
MLSVNIHRCADVVGKKRNAEGKEADYMVLEEEREKENRVRAERKQMWNFSSGQRGGGQGFP